MVEPVEPPIRWPLWALGAAHECPNHNFLSSKAPHAKPQDSSDEVQYGTCVRQKTKKKTHNLLILRMNKVPSGQVQDFVHPLYVIRSVLFATPPEANSWLQNQRSEQQLAKSPRKGAKRAIWILIDQKGFVRHIHWNQIPP